jgi:beta-mannosidase
LSDARTSSLRFASECLAFANLPDERALARWALWPTAGPGWKARTPRDRGVSWDFEDVRDHYLEVIFGVDALELRRRDQTRYVELSRVVTGEVMASTIAEWRRATSTCRGALVWTLRDLVPGAGWGLIDAEGRPKAAYHYLKRACQPLTLLLTDEGCNGLSVHVTNDRPAPFEGRAEVHLFREGEKQIGCGGAALMMPAHTTQEFPVAAWLPEWLDLTCAFQFGRPAVDLVAAYLLDREGHRIADAYYFPLGMTTRTEGDVGLRAEISDESDESAVLTVTTRRFAQSVFVDADDCQCDEQYFHLAPGAFRSVRLTRNGQTDAALAVTVRALNSEIAAHAVGHRS